MQHKYFKTLEFDKILDNLCALCQLEGARKRAMNLPVLTDPTQIHDALSETDEALRLLLGRGNIPLAPVSDIRASAKRTLLDATLSMRELLNIAQTLRVSREIRRFFDGLETADSFPILYGLSCALLELKSLETDITGAILSEDQMADNASANLANIRRKLKTTQNKIRDILQDIIHSQKYQKVLQDALITTRDGRFVVPVKAEQRGELPGIVHDASASGATVFVEPMAVVTAGNELRKLEAEEKEEIERILQDLSSKVAQHAHAISENYNILTTLDFIMAKGKLGLDMNAVMPIMNKDGIIDIKKARHPLIPKNTVVPIDIRLGEDFSTLVITGPNTGGKTVSLKTVGLLTLMAQAGLHIPAESGSRMGIFSQVFADIGDEQSIEQSLSTFSAHMVNIVSIIKHVDAESLVLFDELGAGTDPTEGAALAISILEYVKTAGARAVATTHYSELKLYALSEHGVENASCAFDVATLRPTYRLLIGVPGKSNAFAISKRLGLPEHIIENAKTRIQTDNLIFEDLLTDLEKQRHMAEKERAKAERLRRESQQEKKEASGEKKKLESAREKMMSEARLEARKIVEQAKKEAEAIIRELRTTEEMKDKKAREKAIEEARARLNRSMDELAESIVEDKIAPDEQLDPTSLRIGMYVEVATLGQKGTLQSLPDNNGNVYVQTGILKVKTHVMTLKKAQEPKPQKSSSSVSSGGTPRPTVKSELDVRGEQLTDALLYVERYINDASRSHLETVTIIHGRGTGVLKDGIRKALSKNKQVKSHRPGTYGEGEDGVTVVTLA